MMQKKDDPNASVPDWFKAVFRELVIAKQPRNLEPETMRVYFGVLRDFPHADVAAAAERMKRSTDAFFPALPAWLTEIQNLINLRRDDAARLRVEGIDPTDPPFKADDPRLANILADIRAGLAGDRDAAKRATDSLNIPIKTVEAPRREVIVDEEDPVTQQRRADARAELEAEATRRGTS